MATTTPNYGWDVPTSTDYVKDGATAIETLGDDIDASLFSITSGKNVGLVHISTTSFSAATSVTVSNCFTSAFANYFVVVSLSVTDNAGASGIRWSPTTAGTIYPTAANYFNAGIEQNYSSAGTISGLGNNGAAASFNFGRTDTTDISTTSAFIFNPQVAQRTSYRSFYNDATASGVQGGYLNATNQFDGFNIVLTTGTGTIKVYGLKD